MVHRFAVLGLYIASLLFQGLTATKISGVEDEPTGNWNLTASDALRRALLPGYDRWVRPANHEEATPVSFSLTPTHVYIDETKSIATLIGWMKVMWHDNKLRWNVSDYGGLDVIRVSSDEIWKPDLELYNVASKPPVIGPNANILLYADGTVLWVPPIRFDVFCKLNLKSWPRDSQTCMFIVGSWTHHTLILNLSFDKEGYELTPYEEFGSSKWKIADIKADRQIKFYNCCVEPYASLEYSIAMERVGGSHIIVNEVPIIALVILLIAAAVREPGSRSLILVSVAVISSMYLVSLHLQLLTVTENPPRVVIFYCGILSLAAVWGVTSSIAERLSRPNKKPVPEALKRFVKKSNLNIAADEEGVAMSPENNAPPVASKDSWTELAELFDRALLAAGTLGLCLLFVLNI